MNKKARLRPRRCEMLGHRIKKILEAAGLVGEGEGTHTLRAGNKKGPGHLPHSTEGWDTCLENAEEK